MAAEAVPLSVAVDDNFRVAFVPSGNALSVAVLTAGTTKDLTYSMTPAGFNRQTTEELINDERLTLLVQLQQIGRVTEKLDVQYVFGDSGDVAKAALTRGTTGFIVARYAVANSTAWTVGQKVDVIPIKCGMQMKDAPSANGVFTIKQQLVVTAVPTIDGVLVA